MIRKAAVAGRFYTGNAAELRDEVEAFLEAGSTPPEPAVGIIVPHAGYMYSGPTAGITFASVKIPSRVIVLGPQHYGGGSYTATMTEGFWRTPLGEYPIDAELAEVLTAEIPLLEEDPRPHAQEHAIEVQVPFLQVAAPTSRFVPIALGPLDFTRIEQIGQGLARTVRRLGNGERPLIVASSDMNHYEDEQTTRVKDESALERVVALDAEGLLTRCRSESISMCGVIPSAALLVAARELGAQRAEILDHTTSAAASGDTQRVVGYAGVRVR